MYRQNRISHKLKKAIKDKRKVNRKRKREEFEEECRKIEGDWESWQVGSLGPDMIQIRGDSQMIVQWLNGHAALKEGDQEARIFRLQDQFYQFWTGLKAIPWSKMGRWAIHIYREDNKHADGVANKAMDGKQVNHWYIWEREFSQPRCFRLSFDGGYRAKSRKSGAGWLSEVWQKDVWSIIHEGNATLMQRRRWKQRWLHLKRF